MITSDWMHLVFWGPTRVVEVFQTQAKNHENIDHMPATDQTEDRISVTSLSSFSFHVQNIII